MRGLAGRQALTAKGRLEFIMPLPVVTSVESSWAWVVSQLRAGRRWRAAVGAPCICSGELAELGVLEHTGAAVGALDEVVELGPCLGLISGQGGWLGGGAGSVPNFLVAGEGARGM